MTERIVNGDFATGDFSGWNFSAAPDPDRWSADVDGSGESAYGFVLMHIVDDVICLEQSIDFSGVTAVVFNARIYESRWSGTPPYGVFRVLVDDTVVLTIDADYYDWTAFTADVSGFYGVHALKFCLTNGYYGCGYDITDISADAGPVTPVVDPLWSLQIGPL